jgi:hypothetical protein
VLDPVHLGVNIANDVWTDYVGDSPMVDYRYEWGISQFDTVNLGAYLPGISQTDLTTETTHYRHTDHLGSTWYHVGRRPDHHVPAGGADRVRPARSWGPGAGRRRNTPSLTFRAPRASWASVDFLDPRDVQERDQGELVRIGFGDEHLGLEHDHQ